MKQRRQWLASFVFLILLMGPVFAAGNNEVVKDPVRIGRLQGLAKLWGAIKYFHPYLAYKDIDWDKALIETIPKVEAANTKEEYQAAIDFLLSFLHDPITQSVIEGAHRDVAKPTSKPATEPSQPFIHWTNDNIAVIVANDYDQFSGSAEKAASFRKVFEEAKKAKTIVFDIRNQSSGADEVATFYFTMFFVQTFPVVLNQDLPLSALRYRMYSGYPTQTGGGYRSYFSAFVNEDNPVIRAQGHGTAQIPLVFVVNARTYGMWDLLSSLQATKVASIVLEGAAGSEVDSAGDESGAGSFAMRLPEGIRVRFRTGELVNPDGSIGFHPDVIVPVSDEITEEKSPAIAAALELARTGKPGGNKALQTTSPKILQRLENPYKDLVDPSREYRLLALFRFWNVINYFFPYKHLIDRPWDDVLTEFIPKFEASGDNLQYHLTVARLVKQIEDTHGFVGSRILADYLGTFFPPIQVKSIQGKTVITYFFDGLAQKDSGLNVGDVILSVDGEEIGKRRDRMGDLFAASTPQALRWRVDRAILGGAENSHIALKVQNREGKVLDVTLNRSMRAKKPTRSYPVYTVLPSGYGYIDLERLNPAQVDAAFEALKNTPAIIFDDRGYPQGTFTLLGAHLADKEGVAARFETPTPQSPDLTQESRVKFVQMFKPGPKEPFKGKVVVLINEEAISQSEHTCLFLEAAGRAVFIGSPTSGANGDVTQTVLPGGITVNFTGHDVQHADGRQLQRKGIQPDVLVEPTLEGIRAGKDELLDAAIRHLQMGERR
jgi:C-terminal processing protease CtpA/Prc